MAEGRAVGNKELREYMEVTGYAEAARWVYGQALDPGDWAPEGPVSLTEIRHIHEMALGAVWGVKPHPNANPRERPGSFRQHDIQPFPGGMVPPSWVEVNAAIVDWIKSLSTVTSAENPIESIAAAHSDFERIHPFLDGNGRTGRLIVNLILVRLGYPPAIIYTRDPVSYTHLLGFATRAAQRGQVEEVPRSSTRTTAMPANSALSLRAEMSRPHPPVAHGEVLARS